MKVLRNRKYYQQYEKLILGYINNTYRLLTIACILNQINWFQTRSNISTSWEVHIFPITFNIISILTFLTLMQTYEKKFLKVFSILFCYPKCAKNHVLFIYAPPKSTIMGTCQELNVYTSGSTEKSHFSTAKEKETWKPF